MIQCTPYSNVASKRYWSHIFATDGSGSVLTYEQFMNKYKCPIPFTEYKSVVNSIPSGLLQLCKSHLSSCEIVTMYSEPTIGGVFITDRKCNSKHICQTIHNLNKNFPKSQFN